MGSSIIIGNGNIVSGRSIVINNGVVMVDGNRIDIPENEKIINIQAENVDNIYVDICEKIIIKGNVGGDVDVFQGSVSVGGDVKGDVDGVSRKCGLWERGGGCFGLHGQYKQPQGIKNGNSKIPRQITFQFIQRTRGFYCPGNQGERGRGPEPEPNLIYEQTAET